MQRSCDACGGAYEAKNSRSRYCSTTCQKRGRRAGPAPVVDLPTEPPVTAATRAALVRAGRDGSPEGAVAIALAQKLDAGRDTGSAMASTAKMLLEAMDRALAGVVEERDEIDELRALRERKLAR